VRRPASTSVHLRALAEIANSTDDLSASLVQLLALAQAAVPSCFAVTLSITAEGIPMTVTSSDRDEPRARSSLALRMPRHAGTASGASCPRLVLYAADPGVFDVVARDLIALLDTHMRHAEIDAHLNVPDGAAEADDLADHLDGRSAVDRAIGVLLDRGVLPDEARAQLERRAASAGTSHVTAARNLLGEAAGEPPANASRGKP